MNATPFTPKGNNPFRPGAGLQPPLLAGREDKAAFFEKILGQMEDSGDGRGIVMYGPRGMGKTVLMEQLQSDMQKSGAHTVWITPKKGSLPAKALAGLLPKGARMGDLQFTAATGPLTELAFALEATWSVGKNKQGLFTDHLQAACQKTTRVLFLDEAHTLTRDDAAELVNMAQTVSARGRFMLVLIGTPGLPRIIRKAATFTERFETTSLDMLSEDAAMQALQVPLGHGGITIATEPLREVVRDAQRYPFFIQQWGEALWDCAARHGAQRLTDEHAREVKPAIAAKREDFYNGRLEEIRSDGDLFAATVAVADAFKTAQWFDSQGIVDILDLALKDRAPDQTEREAKAEFLLTELVKIGYIWQPVGTAFVKPGIPSLMDYIAQRRVKRQPTLATADLQRASAESREREGVA